MRAIILNIDLSCCCDPCGSGLTPNARRRGFVPDCDDLRKSGGEWLRTTPSCPNLNGQAMRLALRFVRRPRGDTLGARAFRSRPFRPSRFPAPDRIDCAPTEEKKFASSSRAHSKRRNSVPGAAQAFPRGNARSKFGRAHESPARTPLSRRGPIGRSYRDWRQRACFTARASSRPVIRTGAVAELLPRAEPSRASPSTICKR